MEKDRYVRYKKLDTYREDNRQKVSDNILTDKEVYPQQLDGSSSRTPALSG